VAQKIAVNKIEGTPLENTRRIFPDSVTIKSALVVDDSRVAQASLSRMLKEHGLVVDTAESGSEAIDYLRMNLHPSVIFLDHMMPGMDGFETLRALKSDPRTSTVPVVMYTSTEGESYMGQALAVGAIDVLRKPIDPAELMRILHHLKTGTEQDHAPRPAQEEATRSHVVTLDDAGKRPRRTPAQPPHAAPRQRNADPGPVPHAADLPRDEDATPNPAASPWQWLWRALYTALLLLPAFWYWQQYRQADAQMAGAQREIARLKSEAKRATDSDDTAQLRNTLAAQQRALRVRTRALGNAVAWAVNLQGQYDYDQLPLGDERLLVLRELMARLNEAEFQGVVRIETYVGEFCLVRDEQGTYRLPPRNLPFTRCEVVSHSPEYASLLGRRQSTEFARFLAEPSPNIQIEIISRGNSRPLAAYPDRSIVQTAGEWNQIARLNNRTDISVIPTP
jgi:CheY-like chemotaxis protein